VRLAAAESLPFEDGAFDAVLSQLVVNFLDDAAAGVAEMRRVTKAVVAGCVWDYAGEMRMLRAFWDAAVALDPERAGPLEEGSMRNATPAELEALWSAAGLDDVSVTALEVDASYQGFDDLWQPFTAGIGPAGAYTASLDVSAQVRLRERLRHELGDPDGPFTLGARAWCVTGAKMPT
jgi:SAM-dependent methyltransferase